VDSVVADCTQLFEQSFEVLTSLQEDPNVQRLETEAHEIQQRYHEVKGTAQTIVLTQRLEKLQEAKQLKEQVDAALHKEAMLKARLKPWLDEAYIVTSSIEAKLVTLQVMQQNLQADSLGAMTEQMIEDVK